MRVLIIGGVAGGASAAARLRRLDENAEIVLFERGEYVSFANCGLPYYIGGVIKERANLLVVKPELLRQRFRLDVRVNSEVIAIDRAKKEVVVRDRTKDHEYTERYDKLVLSPGAAPIRPPLPGIDSNRIHVLRNIPDTDAIKRALDEGQVKRAVVIGGGFIGLEMAENLRHRGIKVALVEAAPQVMAPLDFEMAAVVHRHLLEQGVDLRLNDAVKGFADDGKEIVTELASGTRIPAEMVILSIGVRPEVTLARTAGLAVERGIIVDDHMRTSDPDIFAVGDAVECADFATGDRTLVPLAWPANKQGRIAADNLAGLDSRYAGTQGTAIAKVFDLTVAATGANEKTLKAKGIPYQASFTHSAHHAGYYPGAIPLSIKLLFAPDGGKLLGAQVVGYEGVDKRADVLAVALRAGMTVFVLEELELAYAPPYSSAKDPAIMAGMVAANILRGNPIAHWHEVAGMAAAGALLLDVRSDSEFQVGTLPGALNIPVDTLRERIGEIPRDRKLLVFCQVGLRGYVACRILRQHGFACANLSGGYKTWHMTTLPQDGVPARETVGRADQIEALATVMPGTAATVTVDARGLQCPGPIIQLFAGMKDLAVGQTIEVSATDPGFYADVQAWCGRAGHELVALERGAGGMRARIKKGAPVTATAAVGGDDKTIIMFSGDFDKAMATFILANTGASLGRKVTIFFTFWGLNLLRKPKRVRVSKKFIERMFGWMMPRGAAKFKLSKLNMMGMGTAMMQGIMRKKGVASLPELIATAQAHGVKLIACQMTMDLMGIKKEELIDGVEFGGAATYMAAAEMGNVNLFI